MASAATAYNPATFARERFGPGHAVLAPAQAQPISARAESVAQPGDFLLTHSSGVFGQLIRLGQRLQYFGADKVFAHWSHAAIFVDDQGNIIEALGGGVQKRNIEVYRDTEYVVVHLPAATSRDDRAQAVLFAEHSLNESYGWLTIISIGLTLLTGSHFSFGLDGQQICSALVARAIERIGVIFEESEPWHLMPADLAKHFQVTETGDEGRVPGMRDQLHAASLPGNRHR
jgi:uncharacterized protein YycO